MKKVPWMIVVCEWIWKAILVNWCWFAFTILGLGVLGFFPASAALFTIVRKWLRKDTDIPVLKTFKDTYFKEWKRTNAIGLVFYGIGLFLFIDLRIVEQVMTGFLANFLYIFLYILVFVLLLSVGYFFAIYAHYELSNKGYIKQAFLFALTSLPSTVLIVIGLTVIGYAINQYPGLIAFISAVAPALWMMRVCLSRFTALERRAQQH
ncbi:YesL family protein [Neobacillus mesonae]|uniref:YesL family protein n=1 Tax=Neobacillus mesonae TaxID=1193713 RepID=UPI002572CC9F|nr:YesL family protein [Neobacillus mesonae]